MTKRSKKKPESKTTLSPRKIPQLNWHMLDNKNIRKFIYNNRLAFEFEDKTGKELRYASRTEIADFLTKLSKK